MFANLKIGVIGDVILDHYIWGRVERISPEAPVPVVHVERDSWVLGGAANVAANLAGLGVTAELVGPSGTDEAGRRLKSLLAERNIVYHDHWQIDGRTTIIKSRVVVDRQQVCRIDREAEPEVYCVRSEFTESLVDEVLNGKDALILSDYAKGALSQQLLDTISEAAASRGIMTAVDPKPRRRLMFSKPTLMTPNRAEAFELAERSDDRTFASVEAAASKILEMFSPENLVITLGAGGMLVCPAGGSFTRVETQAREVFDVSGAGDTVIATLTAGLASGMTLLDAADLANRAAGVVVGKLGTAVITSHDLAVSEPVARG